MVFRTILKTVLMLGISSTCLARYDVITDDFVDYFRNDFEGKTNSGSKTWDYTTTNRLDIAGKSLMSVTTGHKITASGHVRIGGLEKSSGEMHLVYFDTGSRFSDYGSGKAIGSDVSMTFSYRGHSSGEKFAYPGRILVDEVWSSLHPEGKVTVKVDATKGDNWVVWVSYTVDRGHGDRPGEHVAELVEGLKYKALDVVRSYARKVGVYDVTVRLSYSARHMN